MCLCKTVCGILVIGLVFWFELEEELICKPAVEEVVLESKAGLGLILDTVKDDGRFVLLLLLLATKFGLGIDPTLGFCSGSFPGNGRGPPSVLCGVLGLR